MRRFCAVGMGLNALLLVAFLVLVDAGAGPKVAMTAIYISGVALGFVLHRNWSFVSRSAATQEGRVCSAWWCADIFRRAA